MSERLVKWMCKSWQDVAYATWVVVFKVHGLGGLGYVH